MIPQLPGTVSTAVDDTRNHKIIRYLICTWYVRTYSDAALLTRHTLKQQCRDSSIRNYEGKRRTYHVLWRVLAITYKIKKIKYCFAEFPRLQVTQDPDSGLIFYTRIPIPLENASGFQPSSSGERSPHTPRTEARSSALAWGSPQVGTRSFRCPRHISHACLISSLDLKESKSPERCRVRLW